MSSPQKKARFCKTKFQCCHHRRIILMHFAFDVSHAPFSMNLVSQILVILLSGGRQSRTSTLPTSVVPSQGSAHLQMLKRRDRSRILKALPDFSFFFQQKENNETIYECAVRLHLKLLLLHHNVTTSSDEDSCITRRALDQSSRYADLSLDEDTLIRNGTKLGRV